MAVSQGAGGGAGCAVLLVVYLLGGCGGKAGASCQCEWYDEALGGRKGGGILVCSAVGVVLSCAVLPALHMGLHHSRLCPSPGPLAGRRPPPRAWMRQLRMQQTMLLRAQRSIVRRRARMIVRMAAANATEPNDDVTQWRNASRTLARRGAAEGLPISALLLLPAPVLPPRGRKYHWAIVSAAMYSFICGWGAARGSAGRGQGTVEAVWLEHGRARWTAGARSKAGGAPKHDAWGRIHHANACVHVRQAVRVGGKARPACSDRREGAGRDARTHANTRSHAHARTRSAQGTHRQDQHGGPGQAGHVEEGIRPGPGLDAVRAAVDTAGRAGGGGGGEENGGGAESAAQKGGGGGESM